MATMSHGAGFSALLFPFRDNWRQARLIQMGNLWAACAIALANNVDNLGARIAYSIRGIEIRISVNVWIALITFVISFGAALSGSAAAALIGVEVAQVTAMVLLVALGLWMIVDRWISTRQNEHSADCAGDEADCSPFPTNTRLPQAKQMGLKEATILGVALSINNIGGGMSAGIMGINPYLVGALSALVSFLALWAGNYFAAFFVQRRIADKAGTLGGILLIALGIKQVIG